MTDIFDTLADIAGINAEIIRHRWDAMSPEERTARERHEWQQAKLLGRGISGPAVHEHREAKGRL